MEFKCDIIKKLFYIELMKLFMWITSTNFKFITFLNIKSHCIFHIYLDVASFPNKTVKIQVEEIEI